MIAKLAGRIVVLTTCALLLPNAVVPAAELAIGSAAFVLPMVDPQTASEHSARPAVATAVTVSADGTMVAAGGDDHFVRVWDTRTGERIARLEGHQDWVRGTHFSPNGQQLASVGNDGALRVWNPLSGVEMKDKLRTGNRPLSSVAFHPDGRHVLTVGFRTPMQMFNLTGSEPSIDYTCACEDTRCVAVSKEGRLAAAAGRNGRLRVWDLETGLPAMADVPADTQRIYSVVFSPNGQMIATGGDGRRIRFWSLEDGELLAEMSTGGVKIRSMLFLNSEQLVVGGVDNSISVWSISSRLPTHRLIGHTGAVAGLASDASGKIVASASYDTTVRIWQLGQPDPARAAAVEKPTPLR